MKVHSLFLYPVKSLAGVEAAQLEFDDFGPVADRRWMIVDESGKFVSQRSMPQLALIGTGLDEGHVVISVPGRGDFTLVAGQESLTVGVWRDQALALNEAGKASAAISEFCGVQLRLVYMPDDSFRRVDETRVPDRRRVSFADGFPLLVTNTRSLDDLNRRLDEPVEMRRFRPNIVIDGERPWEEDHWHSLTLDGQTLQLVKPCSRCVMTTVDPDTGIQSTQREPLRTLAGFRRTSEGVIFGMNGVHLGNQPIRVGDPVSVKLLE